MPWIKNFVGIKVNFAGRPKGILYKSGFEAQSPYIRPKNNFLKPKPTHVGACPNIDY
jgi:hypothetical protein